MGKRKDSLLLRPYGRQDSLLVLSFTHSLIHATERQAPAEF